MIDMECDHRHDSGGVQPVKIVAGNKSDLKDARVISSRQGLEFARSRDCGFMETSAREMVNIEETFARMSRLMPFCPVTRGQRMWIACAQFYCKHTYDH